MHTNHKISNCSIVIARSGECVAVCILARGFTGHEHILAFNLINMNARIYDPEIASFISPDNEITYPENPQNYNRYSYAMNNPLKYTDPSGNNPMIGIALFYAFQNGTIAYMQNGFAAGLRAGAKSFVMSMVGNAISAGLNSMLPQYSSGTLMSMLSGIGKSIVSDFIMTGLSGGKYTLKSALNATYSGMQNWAMSYTSSSQNEGAARNAESGTSGDLAYYANNSQNGKLSTPLIPGEIDDFPNKGKNINLPSYYAIFSAYPKNKGHIKMHPHPAIYYKNQCAIRLTYALKKAGTDISKLKKYGNITEKATHEEYGDVGGLGRGARDVGRWLDGEYGQHIEYSLDDFIKLGDSVQGIYLQFPATSGALHHIDVGNSVINGSGFYNSGKIWFWPLK